MWEKPFLSFFLRDEGEAVKISLSFSENPSLQIKKEGSDCPLFLRLSCLTAPASTCNRNPTQSDPQRWPYSVLGDKLTILLLTFPEAGLNTRLRRLFLWQECLERNCLRPWPYGGCCYSKFLQEASIICLPKALQGTCISSALADQHCSGGFMLQRHCHPTCSALPTFLTYMTELTLLVVCECMCTYTWGGGRCTHMLLRIAAFPN